MLYYRIIIPYDHICPISMVGGLERVSMVPSFASGNTHPNFHMFQRVFSITNRLSISKASGPCQLRQVVLLDRDEKNLERGINVPLSGGNLFGDWWGHETTSKLVKPAIGSINLPVVQSFYAIN